MSRLMHRWVIYEIKAHKHLPCEQRYYEHSQGLISYLNMLLGLVTQSVS
jgi:hypothetical protein